MSFFNVIWGTYHHRVLILMKLISGRPFGEFVGFGSGSHMTANRVQSRQRPKSC